MFANSKINKITIGKEVEIIEAKSFENCRYLKEVKFEEETKVKEIKK